MAEFDAGSIEATLELNRDPFEAGVEAAKKEAEDLEKPIVTPLKADVDEASFMKAEEEKKALADPVDFPVEPEADPNLWARIIRDSMKRAVLDPIAVQLGVDPNQYKLKAELIAAMKAAQAGLSPIQVPVEMKAEADLGSEAAAIAKMDIAAAANPVRVPIDIARALRLGALPRDALNAMAVQYGMPMGNAIAYETKSQLISALAAGNFGPPEGGGGGGGLGGAEAGGFMAGWLGKMFAPSAAASHLIGTSLGHMVVTAIPIAVSAIQAAAGGGLLLSGILGVSAVGMGSDIAVMKDTFSEVKNLNTAYQAVTTAVQQYGAGSAQAAAAQSNLVEAMKQAGPAAGAEMKVVTDYNAAIALWDKMTVNARITAAGIMDQVVKLGTSFIPDIAAAATRNLAYISQAIKPLFSWLEGPAGHGIFADLENQFAKELPASMSIFTNSIEIILKTIDHIVQMPGFGSWIQRVADFINNINTTGWNNWIKDVDHLVGVFHIWANFAGAIFKVIKDLLGLEVHTGTSIIQELTNGLDKLNKWLTGPGGQTIKDLFTAHRQQIIDMLHALGIFLSEVGPPLVKLLTTIAQESGPSMVLVAQVLAPFIAQFANLLNLIMKIPGLGQMLALLLVLKGFQSLPFGLGGPIGTLLGWITKLAAAPLESLAIRLGLLAEAETEVGDAAAASSGKVALTDLGKTILGAGAGAAGGWIAGQLLTQYTEQPVSQSQIDAWKKQIDKNNAALVQARKEKDQELVNQLDEENTKLRGQINSAEKYRTGGQLRAGRDVTQAGTTIAGLGFATGNPWVGVVGLAIAAVGEIISHWHQIYTALDTVWQHVDVDARHWWGIIQRDVSGFGRNIGHDAENWAMNVYNPIDHQWQNVARTSDRWFGITQRDISGFGRGIARDANNWTMDVWHPINNQWSNIKSTSDRWFGITQRDISGFGRNIGHDAENWTSNVYHVADNAWHTVDQHARSIWGGITGFFTNTVGGFFTGPFVNFFTRIPGEIMGALSNVGNTLESIGEKIINGLWNGMKTVWNHAKSWLSNLNPANWFNDIAPVPGHADQNLVPIGETVFAGLQKGMLSGWSKTAAWLKTVNPAASMSGVKTAGATGTSAAAVGSQTININIYNPVGQTSEQSIHNTMQKIRFHGLLPAEAWNVTKVS